MSKVKPMGTEFVSRFVQLHFLTSYPPSNLNRDDLGRPKTALLGGANRLRISSQSLKRAWRTSDVFAQSLAENRGIRTKNYGRKLYDELVAGGIKEKDAKTWAKSIAGIFGKLKAEKKDDPLLDLEIEQLAHFSVEEQTGIDALIKRLVKEKRAPEEKELELLRNENSAADIAMFGRMLASKPAYNVEAAVQVAHAITVHKVAVEDDFFTAVDDLNRGDEDKGAGHMGDTEFGAGLFYLYICINRELLLKNLNGDKGLADKTITALVESVATVSPTGKQNSFASRARAMYGLAEKGDEQPRSLHAAFLKPVEGREAGMFREAGEKLTKLCENFDAVYGNCASGGRTSFDVEKGEGSIQDFIEFCKKD